jgi:hypothetical protein
VHDWAAYGKEAVFDKYGTALPTDKAVKIWETTWGIIEKAFRYSNDHSASIGEDESLYDYFLKQAEEIFAADGSFIQNEALDTEKGQSITPSNDTGVISDMEVMLDMANMWGAFVGSPIQKQSLKFFFLEECIDGGNAPIYILPSFQDREGFV